MRMYQIRRSLLGYTVLALSLGFLASCSDDDEPEVENETEIITDVVLTFTSDNETITASAQDPDGDGIEEIEILDDIVLSANTTYELTITVENTVAGESITDEINEESDVHQFFFEFTEDIFSDPSGDGNVDNRDDDINYDDEDVNGLPVGLQTTWTTGAAGEGSFRVLLKHQPDIKSSTSTSEDGESDIDLTWDLEIQ